MNIFALSLILLTCFQFVQSQTPPTTWQEHWFEHNQLLQRVFYDADVAVYYDDDMSRSVTWLYQLCGNVWRYSKQIYGDMDGGGNDHRLWAIFHQNKYGGGHPSYYYDGSHDYRNVIDLGQTGSWNTPTGWSLDATVHEVAHIVESTTHSTRGSPCFSLWRDSKWAEIYNYDVYVALGMTTEANRWYQSNIENTDSFPRAGTQWFKNWFFPIWNTYGHGQALSKFFALMAQWFPQDPNGTYTRDMNWGEFVWFWSGAVGADLKPLATTAFGWPTNFENQWQQARRDFPFLFQNTTSLTNVKCTLK